MFCSYMLVIKLPWTLDNAHCLFARQQTPDSVGVLQKCVVFFFIRKQTFLRRGLQPEVEFFSIALATDLLSVAFSLKC